jgi:ABC-type transporter Mla subunit MlaD
MESGAEKCEPGNGGAEIGAQLSDIATLVHALTEKVDALAAQLNDVVAKLDGVAAQLNGVAAAHASTTEGVSRMTGHIDFVEGVYDTLRHPLSRLTGLVRRQELPAPPGVH